MTFQPVNSLLSWFIATEWKQFSTVDVHGAQKVLSNNGFWKANCFCCLSKCHGVLCLLSSRITTKVLKNCKTYSSRPKPRPRPNVQDQDQDFMIHDQDQDFSFFFLKAPQDQDPAFTAFCFSHTVVFYLNGCTYHQGLSTFLVGASS